VAVIRRADDVRVARFIGFVDPDSCDVEDGRSWSRERRVRGLRILWLAGLGQDAGYRARNGDNLHYQRQTQRPEIACDL